MADDPLLGKILDGRFKILEVLGSGGMGTVYKARELSLERIVALKVLQSDRLLDSENRIRFEREGKIIASLSHKHITQFYCFGISGDSPYIGMEYVEGKSLRSVLSAEGHLEWRRASAILIQVSEALYHAHNNGILHRDLKPENIMLLQDPAPDFVKIVDFGLAAILPDAQLERVTLTQTGQLVGSVNYMSPEQCIGHKPDQRADIYALGCVMFETLLGEPPFSADVPMGVVYKHANEQQRRFGSYEHGRNVPAELEQIVAKAMMKKPESRYQSMLQLHEDINVVLDGKGAALSAGEISFSEERRSKNYSLIVLASIIGMLAVAGASLFYFKTSINTNQKSEAKIVSARDIVKRGLAGEKLSINLIDDALKSERITDDERGVLLFLRATGAKQRECERAVNWSQAIASLKLAPAGSYPRFVLLQSMDGMARQAEYRALTNTAVRYLRSGLAKGKNNRVPDPFIDGTQFKERLTLKYMQQRLVEHLYDLQYISEAIKVLDEFEKDPSYMDFSIRNFLHLGLFERARALVDSTNELDALASDNEAFRKHGLLKDGLRAVYKAERNLDERQKRNFLHSLTKSEALCLFDLGRKDEACEALANFIKADLQSPSMTVNRKANGATFIVHLFLCGGEEQATRLLEQYCKKQLPADEAAELKELQEYVQKFQAKLPAARCHFFLQQIRSPGVHFGLLVCLGASSFGLVERSKDKEIAAQLKLDVMNGWLDYLDHYILPHQVIRLCDQIISNPESERLHRMLSPSDLPAVTLPTFQCHALMRKAMKLKEIGKESDCITVLEKCENSESLATMNELSSLFALELKCHRLKQAEEIIARCTIVDSLYQMISRCYPVNELALADKCIARMKVIESGERDRLLRLTQTAILAIEKDKPAEAKSVFMQILPSQIKNLSRADQDLVFDGVIWVLANLGMFPEAQEMTRMMID